jgi:Domain of unknown function (DUF5668)
MGPAVLITLGVLFLLAQVSSTYWLNFDRTWPALLIVIGLVSFLRHSAPMNGHVPREYAVPQANAGYVQAPYGQAPSGQAPYGQTSYGQTPYGHAPATSGSVVTPVPIQPGSNLPAPYQQGDNTPNDTEVHNG